MKKTILFLSFIILLSVNQAFSQENPSKYQISGRIHLDGDGGWDYLTIDESTSRLYISHGSMVQVLDVNSQTVVGEIPDTKGVHGITLASDLNKGFISDGRDTSVTVFDLKTLNIIAKVKITGLNPDAILYDAFSRKVFIYNGRTSNVTVIDAITNSVIGTIALPGKPEFSVTDLKGNVFVNIEDQSEICVINSTTLKIEQTWSISPGKEPSGLAIDRRNNRLFSVCDNKLMVVIDSKSGKVVTTTGNGENVDGVAFDSVLQRIYTSNGEGSVTIIQEENENTFKVLENFTTQKGARTIALNSITHKIYLPTAEYGEMPPPTEERPHPRPPIKPNTFTILEVSQK